MADKIKLGLRLIALLMSGWLLVPSETWGDQIDPTVVARILGQENPPRSDPQAATTTEKMADYLANIETKQLGQNDRDWNASNPKWKSVFDHVRSDLQTDLPAAMAAARAATPAFTRDYEADIAAQLLPSDVDAILTYYASPEGGRYQAFMRRIDAITGTGMASLGAGDSPPVAGQTTAEQLQRNLRMVRLSRTFQAAMAAMKADMEAHRDLTGYSGIGILEGVAASRNQAELETLDKQYAADLPGFEAFSKSDSAQHFFKAMGAASIRLARRQNPFAELMQAAAKKHEIEWKALYQAEVRK
ncbi:MAG: hypothetical protein ACLQJR_19275 [Stellaceae bacterium]